MRLLLIAFCLFAYPLAHAIDAEGQISYVDQPGWVVPVSFSTDHSHCESGDLAYHLVDVQGHGPESALYEHEVIEYLTKKGVQEQSEISIWFDPSYQTIEVHSLKIHRKGQVIDQLGRCRRKVVQPEGSSRHCVYTNDYSLILFLDDVRKGDLLEYAYTVKGELPAFKGYEQAYLLMAGTHYIEKLHYRFLENQEIPVYWKGFGGEFPPITQCLGDDLQEWKWEAERLEPISKDSNRPAWHSPFPRLQVSKYGSWKEVVQTVQPLLSRSEEKGEALIEYVESLQRDYPNTEDQLLAAIRFVQDEIRYLSLDEEGGGGYRPHPPEEVWTRRAGDCKDKTMLLVALCDLLEVESHPVLVHHNLGKRLPQALPSRLFDHAITHFKFEGKSYFVDPTWSAQGGTLQEISCPPYSYALIIDENTEGLTPISLDQFHGKRVRERTYLIDPHARKADFELQTTLSGAYADMSRGSLEGIDPEDLRKYAEEKYRGFYEEIESTKLPEIGDDRLKNQCTFGYAFQIEELGEEDEENGELSVDLFPLEIDGFANQSFSLSRTAPLALPFPYGIEEIIHVETTSGVFADLADKTSFFENPYFEFTLEWVNAGENKKMIRSSFRTLKDAVEVEELPQFKEALKALRKETGISFTLRTEG